MILGVFFLFLGWVTWMVCEILTPRVGMYYGDIELV